MSTSTIQTSLIYGVNDRPPLRDALFAAIQHLLAIFVAIITPPLIIAKALGLDTEMTGFLVSMSLFASGVATFIQCRKIGPVGCGMLCVQGTSFSFIGPIIAIGTVSGLPAIFGACVLGAPIEILVSCTFKYLRRVITPLVSGIVVMLIGLTLIKAGIVSCGGGNVEAPDFGSMQNLTVSVIVLVSVIIFNLCPNRYLRMSSIFIGIIIGYATAFAMGMVDLSALNSSTPHFYSLLPFQLGFKVVPSAIIAMGIVYLVTAIEATGDVTANSMISGLPVDDKGYTKRVAGGVMADGVNSMIAGLFSSFPNSIFAQNNGIIQLTGVASRYVGYFIAVMLVLLGIFPVVGIIFSMMPAPVLGGATLLMFGTVAATGVRIVASQEMDRRAVLVLATSLAFGMGVELMPDILRNMPDSVRTIFSSGITTGGLTAIIANAVLKVLGKDQEKKNTEKKEVAFSTNQEKT